MSTLADDAPTTGEQDQAVQPDCGGGCPKTGEQLPAETPDPAPLEFVEWTDENGDTHNHGVHTDCGGGCPKFTRDVAKETPGAVA